MRVSSRVVALGLAAATLVGCGSVTPSTPAPSASPTRAAPSAPVSSASPAAVGSPSSLGPASSAAVAADPSLLDLVPAAAAGLTLTYDPDTTATVGGDAAVARDASALAVGLAMPTGQASPEEFVIVNAVRLRDPSVGEDWFRDWRDTYDTAACDQAGGVQGHAESEIGGRKVYIGSCTNGVFTYHVRIEDGSVVLSITSIGPGRLGERLVRQLPAA